ncbi:YopT-type cysteine protease domain-containing protein [Pseudomonas sp. TUM22785]|uniref:YopT-type cysteine protease domain-containing protein n=1 Tax=Pseudomonas sp. TUM22785 TaxID=3019098 RepID=UPI002305BEF2|nr:YopT-type cysteine protease domain-containing protein [Pseudomonas sp. TUM22785]WCD77774.1 YopT-type cysteine protease domain-containing protein [Pseudomonas sp. TUM22785]
MTIERHKVSQSTALAYTGNDARGVCLEACRRWVRAVLAGHLTPGETIYDIIGPETIQELLESHRQRNKKSDNNMEGFGLTVTKREGGGPFKKFTGLRTRQDVIDHVLAVPGAYIYVVDGADGGHAMAFSSLDRDHVLFLDPNVGEWELINEDQVSIRSWWKDFWAGKGAEFEGLVSYKKEYHKGGRELWQYKVVTH